ncbi:hypothetical protein CPB85DRAFT_439331 [Mucidula mucida]|nr:hypothetical protein CPB85DRAFT_439331 [Mucidula mucida]
MINGTREPPPVVTVTMRTIFRKVADVAGWFTQRHERRNSILYKTERFGLVLCIPPSSVYAMSMQSKVGNAQIHEANEQRPNKTDVGQHHTTDAIGQRNAHDPLDSKDQRTHPNTASAAAAQQENSQRVTDPLAPALAHGNEPSRGAKIDAQLQAEDEEMLRKKK